MAVKIRGRIGPLPMRRRWNVLLRALWLVSVACLFILIAALMDEGADLALVAALNHPWVVFLNALPGLLVAWAILTITRRALFAFWIVTLLYGAMGAVNRIKIANLQTPLLPQDAGFLWMMDASSFHLFGAYAGSLILMGLGLVVVAAFSSLLFVAEAPLLCKGGKERIAVTAVLLCCLLYLGPLGHGWRRFYDGSHFRVSTWSPLETYQRSGLVNELIAFYMEYRDAGRVPRPSVSEAKEVLNRYAGPVRARLHTGSKNDVRPDIVVKQSEAFFDPSVLNHIEPQQVLPYFHTWQSQGSSGWLHVPTFGGGTIRTEFEVVTGLSLRSFPNVSYPYLQFSYSHFPGLVEVLNKHGYDTRSIHANGPGFWNRQAIFAAFGFRHQTWLAGFDKPKYDGPYVSDASMTDQIIRELDEPRSGRTPRFIFAISIENHGPYKWQPHINEKERKSIEIPAGLDPEASSDLRSYLYHLQHVDVELNRLIQHVMHSSRPTLLFFYGDHLPSLVPVFKQLGFRNGADMLTQPVPWLAIGNSQRQPIQDGDMAAWMLPSMILHAAGVDDDIFFALKSVIPRDLAIATHSPWVAEEVMDMDSGRLQLLEQLAQIDRLRLMNRLKPLAAATINGHNDSAPVEMMDSRLGSYVTADYRIGGVADSFPAQTPLFARIDLAGESRDVFLRVNLVNQAREVVREGTYRVGVVDGAATINLDLRKGTELVPGRYFLKTKLNGQVVGNSAVQMR